MKKRDLAESIAGARQDVLWLSCPPVEEATAAVPAFAGRAVVVVAERESDWRAHPLEAALSAAGFRVTFERKLQSWPGQQEHLLLWQRLEGSMPHDPSFRPRPEG